MRDEIVCIIPARGGSKRLKRKNIYPLLGKPLLQYTVEAALATNFITRKNLFVSIEDEEIKNFC